MIEEWKRRPNSFGTMSIHPWVPVARPYLMTWCSGWAAPSHLHSSGVPNTRLRVWGAASYGGSRPLDSALTGSKIVDNADVLIACFMVGFVLWSSICRIWALRARRLPGDDQTEVGEVQLQGGRGDALALDMGLRKLQWIWVAQRWSSSSCQFVFNQYLSCYLRRKLPIFKLTLCLRPDHVVAGLPEARRRIKSRYLSRADIVSVFTFWLDRYIRMSGTRPGNSSCNQRGKFLRYTESSSNSLMCRNSTQRLRHQRHFEFEVSFITLH